MISVFIAHSREDEKSAVWLERELRSFKIPRNQRSPNDGRKKLGEIFRDGGEFSESTDLGFAVRRALDQFDALIVVCGSKTSESAWVNEEVRTFISINPDRPVFVLLVGSSQQIPPTLPNSMPAEPLAADARGNRRRSREAVTRIVAGLLGCTFEDLRQRRRADTIRRQFAFWLPTLAIAMGLGVWSEQERRAQEIETEAYLAEREATNEVAALTCYRVVALGEASFRLEQQIEEPLKQEARSVRNSLSGFYWQCVGEVDRDENRLNFESLKGTQDWLAFDRPDSPPRDFTYERPPAPPPTPSPQ